MEKQSQYKPFSDQWTCQFSWSGKVHYQCYGFLLNIFRFYCICRRNSCTQTLNTLIKSHILRDLNCVCTVLHLSKTTFLSLRRVQLFLYDPLQAITRMDGQPTGFNSAPFRGKTWHNYSHMLYPEEELPVVYYLGVLALGLLILGDLKENVLQIT